ncbi:MAG: hypothetical protein HUU20_15215 [Pirellulales bacterium]|nr:hypothetical protein [Pirellulales bacterium]
MSHEPVENDPIADPPPLEEELVAYLDGELDAQAERRIEQLLAADPTVRETLRQLEHTWELLDDLGAADVDETFTRTTLEMVAVEAEEEVRQVTAELPRRRGWRLAMQLGGLGAAALAGFLAVALLRPDPNRQLLEDLPVLENLDQYEQVGDIQFLEMLREAHLFEKEDGHGT